MNLLYKTYQAYTFKINTNEKKIEFKPKPRARWNSDNKYFNLRESNNRFKEFQKINKEFDYLKQKNLLFINSYKYYKSLGLLSLILGNQPNHIDRQFPNYIPIFNQTNMLIELNKKNIELESLDDEPDYTLFGLMIIGAGVFGLYKLIKH